MIVVDRMSLSKVFPTLIGARYSNIVQEVKTIEGNVNSLGWMSDTLGGSKTFTLVTTGHYLNIVIPGS